jgi:ABC-2 type transport system permease protein/capsular polysaccharide transport system permease protein
MAYDNEVIDKIWHPTSYILFPLSGAAFLVDALPKVAQDFVLWFPMVHAIEMLREGYFGSSIRGHYDVGYLAGTAALLTLVGLARVRVLGRRIIPV